MASSRKAADQARYRETRQTTKAILKAKGLAQKLEVAQALLQSGEEYGKRVKGLQEYHADWKAASEADKAKLQWNEEWEKLKESEERHEQAVDAALQSLTLDDNAGVVQALHEANQALEARNQLAGDLMLDTRGLASALKALLKRRERSQPEDLASFEQSMSKFAQALISTHKLYEEVSGSLNVEMVETSTQLQQAKVSLRTATLGMQNASVLQELESLCAETLQKHTIAEDAAQVVALEVDMWQLEMHEKLQALDERRISQFEELEQLHAAASQEFNAEPIDAHEWDSFVEMYKICSSKQKTRGALLEQLAQRLPEIPTEQIKMYEVLYRSRRALANRKQDINNSFKAMRTATLEEGQNALAKSIQSTLRSLEQQRKLAAHEQYRKQVHDRLAHLRAEHQEQEHLRQQEEAAAQQRDELEAAEREEAVRREREAKSKLIAKYQETKRELEAKQREMEEQAAAEELQMRKQRMLTNQARLQFRQQLLETKEQNRLRALELAEQEAAHRMEVLEKLAQQVPYFDRIQEATADLSKTTAAVEAAAYLKPEELLRGQLPLNGFADTQVMQDSRFRLALALREAGVIQSNYAKSIIQALHPRPQAPI